MNALRQIAKELAEFFASEEQTIALAAGEMSKVEIARPGKFEDMHGTPVVFTPDNLRNLAETFDGDKDHKLKLGHTPILTDTPDYGDVVKLEWDGNRDRLLAHVRPTEALVEKNRKGAFRRASMELSVKGENQYRFGHLSLLGAKRPAIRDLAEISLAEGEPPDGMIAVLADGEPSVLLTAPETFNADALIALEQKSTTVQSIICSKDKFDSAKDARKWAKSHNFSTEKIDETDESYRFRQFDPESCKSGSYRTISLMDGVSAVICKKETKMEENVAAMAQADGEKEKRFKERRLSFAKEVADGFLSSEAIIKRIPMPVLKAGNLQRLALRLSEMDVEGEGGIVELASADGARTPSTPWEVFKAVMLSFPEKLKEDETTETAKRGAEEPEPANMAEFADADTASVEIHLAAEKAISEEKAKTGNVISYYEALRRLETARSRSK